VTRPSKALLGMVHLPDGARIQLTALNFSCQPVAGGVRSEHLPPGATVVDMSTDQVVAEVDREHSFTISLAPHQGMSLLAVPG
jgi:hypothetical protein